MAKLTVFTSGTSTRDVPLHLPVTANNSTNNTQNNNRSTETQEEKQRV